ncbi:MAG: 2-oxoglutarate dehydrogenase E2 component [Geobacteraceae bacterium]|nr:MAG: 2-oxoglutarate dehydrogenase E2 component [Geobacteraceae bacterium]
MKGIIMEIKVPEVGESVFEALVARWYKKDGERVAKDEPLCEVETDKITFEISAEAAGILSIGVPEGTTVKIGSVIGAIEEKAPLETTPREEKKETVLPAVSPAEPARRVPPSERKAAREKEIEAEKPGSGKREAGSGEQQAGTGDRGPGIGKAKEQILSLEPRTSDLKAEGRETRKPMTPIRRRIAERLLSARQQTAMLTSFNEADMSGVAALRQKHREDFKKKHGVSLGLMPFFVKACVEALQEFPQVNARIDGDDIVYHHFYDIGIAVSGEKGLVVPVLRDADRLHFAGIEKTIEDFVERIRTNKLNISDLEGGTFTITNGGVFGSLLSTPIINPPQSAVLGMHAIQDRPVARDGKVVIQPMMYLALSYDHRIIDGREAVQFLKKVKDYIEEPVEMLLEG